MRTWTLLLVVVVVGCSQQKPPGKYPPREPGCEIHVYTEDHVPTYETDNIGSVNASCSEETSDADCMRVLKDEACKLGADTLWGVSDTPTKKNEKKFFSGRAAHQK